MPGLFGIRFPGAQVGAFSGTDLDMLLKANRIDTLLLAGITTTGVILSTLRQAFDLDYRLAVVRDCCADHHADVHQMLLEKLFPLHATVTTSEEIIQVLQSQRFHPEML